MKITGLQNNPNDTKNKIINLTWAIWGSKICVGDPECVIEPS